MPTYEYRCEPCGKVSSIFFRSFSQVTEPRCPSCQSSEMSRLISRVAVVRSKARGVLDIDAERALSGLDRQDKGSIVRWAKRVGREFDDQLGSQFRDMAERVESGEEHYGLTVDGDYTFRYKVAEEQARARGEAMESSDPWSKSPTTLPPVKGGPDEV